MRKAIDHRSSITKEDQVAMADTSNYESVVKRARQLKAHFSFIHTGLGSRDTPRVATDTSGLPLRVLFGFNS